MSFFNKMTNKMQETASATKLIATLKRGNEISKAVIAAYIKNDLIKMISLVEGILDDEAELKKAEAYSVLGGLCFNAKSDDLAEENYLKSLVLSPQVDAYMGLGYVYLRKNKIEKARDLFYKALEMNSKNEDLFFVLIKLLREIKDYESLIDIIWKYLQVYGKSDWLWKTNVYLFDQKSWAGYLCLSNVGTALCYVLRDAMETEDPNEVIRLSEVLSSQPFPLFITDLEKAAYHWVRSEAYKQMGNYSKCADEWYKIASLNNLPLEIKSYSNAEWRANELAGHFDPIILNQIYNREPLAKQGQFMKATILFCDIRGFSRFSYEFRHAPQVILQFLEPYFDSSQEIIAKHNGILDKFLGDGFISLFIPKSQTEEDYQKSVYDSMNAAIELQQTFASSLPSLFEIWKKNMDETTFLQMLIDHVGLGIGIHSGFMYLGSIGSQKRRQFTALGNVVNFSARLQSKAPKGCILLSAPVYEYVKTLNLNYSLKELPEEEYTDLKNIPGSYSLYIMDCNKSIDIN